MELVGAVEVHEVSVGERPSAGQQRKAPGFWTVSVGHALGSFSTFLVEASARMVCLHANEALPAVLLAGLLPRVITLAMQPALPRHTNGVCRRKNMRF